MKLIETTGTTSLDDSERLRARDAEILKRQEAFKGHTSPLGTLGLDRHLDEARVKFGIPDTAFDVAASYDRVFVFQVSLLKDGKKGGDSMIHLPDSTLDREKNKAPTGCIVSAGLRALDILKSNGHQLGDVVLHTNAVPYFVRFDNISGHDQHMIVLKAGQISGNYDLAERLKNRAVRLKLEHDSDGSPYHAYIDENGKSLVPQLGDN